MKRIKSDIDEEKINKTVSAIFAENNVKGSVTASNISIAREDNASQCHATCTEEHVKAESRNFLSSSAAEQDRQRPGHLKTLVIPISSAHGTRLLTTLTSLVNDVIAGGVPEDIWQLFHGGSLCALTKGN